MMKVAIIGTRSRDTSKDYAAMEEVFEQLVEAWPDSQVHIVSGGCPRGGDRFAQQIAKERGLPITIFYPNWSRYGKGAGVVRNTAIAEECDFLIACVASDRKGGTEDTIKKARKSGKEIILVMPC